MDENLVNHIWQHPDDPRREQLADYMRDRVTEVKGRADKRLAQRRLANDGQGCTYWTSSQEMQEGTKKPEGRRQWRYEVVDSCWVKRRDLPEVAPFLYIGADLYFGAGWEIQIFGTQRFNGVPDPPNRLQGWLERNGIETHPTELAGVGTLNMDNLLAYGQVLGRDENPGWVAQQFCDLIERVDFAHRNPRPQ